MTRIRVFVLVAALAVTSLAGCRSDPAVAAYLGAGPVTVSQVERIAADLHTTPAQRGEVKGYVLGSMIIREVGRRLVAERSLTPSRATAAEAVAKYYDLPVDAPVVSLVTETQNILLTLATAVTPVGPDRDQQRAAFDALYFPDGRPVAQRHPFERVQYLLNRDTIGRMIALRRVLDAAVAASGITVNPRYAGLTYGLPVEVRLGQDTGPARASILVHLTVDEVPAEEV
jgi:hypothetical protein